MKSIGMYFLNLSNRDLILKAVYCALRESTAFVVSLHYRNFIFASSLPFMSFPEPCLLIVHD